MEKELESKLINEANEIIKKHGIENFAADSIVNVNHRPHIPMVGQKTMEYANHNCGIIDDNAPCSVRGCNLKFCDHKSDTVMFIKLSAAILKEKANPAIVEIAKAMGDNIDGFAFVQKDETCEFI